MRGRGTLLRAVPSWGEGTRRFSTYISQSLDDSSPGRGLTSDKTTLFSQGLSWLIVEGHRLADPQWLGGKSFIFQGGSEKDLTITKHGLILDLISLIYDPKILIGDKKGYHISSYDIFNT